MALTETVTLRPKVRNATNLFLSLKTLSWNPEVPSPHASSRGITPSDGDLVPCSVGPPPAPRDSTPWHS